MLILNWLLHTDWGHIYLAGLVPIFLLAIYAEIEEAEKQKRSAQKSFILAVTTLWPIVAVVVSIAAGVEVVKRLPSRPTAHSRRMAAIEQERQRLEQDHEYLIASKKLEIRRLELEEAEARELRRLTRSREDS